MENRVWKKYEMVDLDNGSDSKSYDELFEDLKDSGKEWGIAYRRETCKNHLTGENEFKPGDIYVYYVEKNGTMVPEFYLKIMDSYDFRSKKKTNLVMFNGATLGYDGIEDHFLPDLIAKLREIDEEKNAKYIRKLEERYANYQRLLFLKLKETYTEEELIFIYYMAYQKNSALALELIKLRNIKADFANFSDENKANMFAILKDNQVTEQFEVTSKDVLLGIAQKGILKHLPCTSEELLNSKELILEVLGLFFEASKNLITFDLEDYLPVRYQSDLEVLDFIFEHLQMNSFTFWMWVQNNPELKEKISDPNFVRRVMSSLVSNYVKQNELYPQYATYLTTFPTETVEHIEDYLLIGPEPTPEREKLKAETLTLIEGEKKLVLARRDIKRA